MALEGSLSDFGLADILQLIYFQRKTGVLTLDGRMDRVKLSFIDGNISAAESRRRVDDKRLGKILVKKGLIKEEDLQGALEEHKKTGEKLGNILVKKGVVGKETISEIVNSQITETVIQLFNWKEGTYEFKAQKIAQDREMPFSLDTQHLLMEGLRIVDEWSAIKGKITPEMLFKVKEESPVGLSDEEETIFRYVDGENDVGTIVDISGKDNFEVSKTLLALLERGIIEIEEEVPVVATGERTGERKQSPLLNILVPAAIFLSLVLSLSVVAFKRGGPSKEFRAAAAVEELRHKVETYRLKNSTYPVSLDAITHKSDPWGRRYIYRVSGDFFYLHSVGADGRDGTADDID
jgi:hypothetical protein